MRLTEALYLSDPKNKLDADTMKRLTHLDIESNREAIIEARKANRKEEQQHFIDIS